MYLCVCFQEPEQQASADVDASGRRPRRKAAVSANKSLRASRDSPDGAPSDDEYKGGSGEEAVSADDAMGSADEEEEEEDDGEL